MNTHIFLDELYFDCELPTHTFLQTYTCGLNDSIVFFWFFLVIIDFMFVYCITETEDWTPLDKYKEEEPLNP